MKRKILSAFLCCVFLLLSGCNVIDTKVEELLQPPRPSGELYYIQKALDDAVNEPYTLEYPTSGDNRSAFVMCDVDGDADDDVFAFYSTTADNVVYMHVNYIRKNEDKWTSVSDFKCVAGGVDTVSFADMDGDGIKEIIIGWSVYGAVDRSVGVYTLGGYTIAQRVIEKYTNFICQDIDGDKKSDLFLSYIDSANRTATAKLISLNDTGVAVKGSCALEGAVTSHLAPIVAKMVGGETAIYIDAVQGDGMITEILGVNDGEMYNALASGYGVSVMSTYRATGVSVRDIDSDGVYEIPLMELITQGGYVGDNVYKTYWYAYDGKYLNLKESTIMNYADGWYITLPDKWDGTISVVRDTANRERTFMRIDADTGNSAEEILKIRTVPLSTPISSITSYGFTTFEITRNDEYYFAASISNTVYPESLTEAEVKGIFHLIK